MNKWNKSNFLLKYEHKSEPSESSVYEPSEFDDINDDISSSQKSERANQLRNIENAPVKKSKWIISETGAVRLVWDMAVIIFAIYNSIMTPFLIAFDPPWSNSLAIVLVDWIINIFFIVDILINFRTTYTNTKTGAEVWEPKKIAKHYVLGGKFWIDILSSIPFDGLRIDSISFLNVIDMLKTIRILRISKLIQHLNMKQETKAFLKTIQLLFHLLLFIHIQAWVWWILVTVEKSWVPNMDFIFYETQIYSDNVYKQYFSSFYHSVMLFGVNEMAARSEFVLITSSFIMLFSAMVNANIIGQVAVLLGDMSKKSVKFTRQFDTANTAMKNIIVSNKVQKRVREYLLNTQATQDQQEELQDFLKNISPSLRFKVLQHIFSGVLKLNYVFSYLIKEHGEETVVPFLVRYLDILLTIPETEIVKQGQDPFQGPEEPRLYFVAKGECQVLIQTQEMTQPTKVKKLRVGDHFGEIALLYNCRRTATVISTKYATIGYLPLSRYKEVLFKFQEMGDMLQHQVYSYSDNLKQFKENRLREIPYFKNLEVEPIHDLIFKLKIMHYEKGHVLLNEQDTTNKCYIVQDGLLDIETFVDTEFFVLESLPRGSILNYRRFHIPTKFELIARCKTATTVLYLDEEDFIELWEKYESIYNEFLKFEEMNEKPGCKTTLLLDFLFPISSHERQEAAKFLKRKLILSSIVKNWALTHLWEVKKKRKPSLNDILKKAIALLRTQNSSKFKRKKKNLNNENDDDSGENKDDEENQEEPIPQDEFLDCVLEDFEAGLKQSGKAIQQIEEYFKMLELQKK